MAVSRAALLKELLPALNELFGSEYEKNVWAVRADYDHEHMQYKIIEITPWWKRDPAESDYNVYKVEGAADEMDAYKKFMEQRK